MSASEAWRRTTALRVIAVLISLVIAESAMIGWVLLRPAISTAPLADEAINQVRDENSVRKAYPGVDFTRIYPGWSAEDIDLLQRESGNLRYVYEPFLEFRPLPVKKRFVEVAGGGYRVGSGERPWPPDEADFAVFVFGGASTFGDGLSNEQTLVARLQEELDARNPELRAQVYNFGSAYYFSTQERALFESLLVRGNVPDAAIFIDGIGDYYYAEGRPELTAALQKILAPDFPVPARPSYRWEEERSRGVDAVLARYGRNLRMAEAMAQEYGVEVVFIGQPSPFVDFKRDASTYPFVRPPDGYELAAWGYSRFEQAALDGAFGSRFIWCGDAFANATSIMYADGINYSPEGARVLARTIVERAEVRGLLP